MKVGTLKVPDKVMFVVSWFDIGHGFKVHEETFNTGVPEEQS
jgi:hypothetical protein